MRISIRRPEARRGASINSGAIIGYLVDCIHELESGSFMHRPSVDKQDKLKRDNPRKADALKPSKRTEPANL